MNVLAPADAADAREIVEQAAARRQSLEIVAGGSKRRLGRPTACDAVLDVSALSGVIDYDPAELVLTAHAATPMTLIQSALGHGRQMLAFEPPDWRGMLGGGGTQTLGGVVACNLAGPRRVRAGAARDHLLGFAAINGRGEAWRSGGRVVKNVTGYDLCKLQAGAFGTLSVLTELSVRVVPRPDTSCSLMLPNLSDDDAIAAMSHALNTPHEVSAAAHLPGPSARRSGVACMAECRLGGTVLRLEGHAPSVAFRARALQDLFTDSVRLDAAESELLWAEIGAVSPLLPGTVIWRVCPTPSRASQVLGRLREQRDRVEALYDWGGGLLWLSLDETLAGPDAGAALVRTALGDAGGHATLIAAPDRVRAECDVFQPQPAPLAALSDRVKASFDPHLILNPGRMQKDR